jgi:para-aminobenzoate synthetase / 4-amino-4-deoxychorismate lyase
MQQHRSLPDQQQGVFETLLVVDGRPVELAAHLSRLGASLRTLFGAYVPEGTDDAVRDRARDLELGRLRVTVVPDGPSGPAADIRVAAVEPSIVFPAAGVCVTQLLVPGGWGAHKWADRGPLAAAESDGSIPLVVDHEGTVLEASRANVFIVESGAIVTPPTDGRILPGVTRSRLLALLDAREEIISLQRLTDADEVFLSGSVRGVEPVAVCRRARVWEPGPVTRSAADELRRHWEVER